MRGFFSRREQAFFPGAMRVVSCRYTHRPTLSTSSYLTRFDVTVQYPNGKRVHHVRGNTVDQQTSAIFRRLAQTKHVFRSPRPLDYLTPPGYILYEETSGSTLRQLAFTSSRWPAIAESIGGSLAAFHCTPARGLRQLHWRQEVDFLRTCHAAIVRRSPSRRTWATRVITVLQTHERLAWSRQPGLTHKDFQASNIILGSAIGIIDFTLSGVGPTAFDLGTFVTHLAVMCHGRVAESRVQHWRERFLQGYAKSIGAVSWRKTAADVPIFELRSAIDILSITLQTLGEDNNPGRAYCQLLTKRIDVLVKLLTQS